MAKTKAEVEAENAELRKKLDSADLSTDQKLDNFKVEFLKEIPSIIKNALKPDSADEEEDDPNPLQEKLDASNEILRDLLKDGLKEDSIGDLKINDMNNDQLRMAYMLKNSMTPIGNPLPGSKKTDNTKTNADPWAPEVE